MAVQDDDRGQTAIDFVVGIALFLLAVAFVLAFVPSMFAPFFGMGAGDGLVADRSAAHLAENNLVADPSTPGVLDGEAVEAFFDECANASSGAWLATELGVGTENINVSISGIDGSPCGNVPAGAETVSKRIVTVDGEQQTLEVIVW